MRTWLTVLVFFFVFAFTGQWVLAALASTLVFGIVAGLGKLGVKGTN